MAEPHIRSLTVTSKGQVTLSASARKQLDEDSQDKILVAKLKKGGWFATASGACCQRVKQLSLCLVGC